MQKNVTFESQSELKEFKEYNKDKLAIAKVCVLSTAPNTHGLIISEEVLRRDMKSIQGQFLVAHMLFGDARSHDEEEVPVGYFVTDRDIEFEEVEQNGEKVVKAWAYAVLSKKYAKEAYEMFVRDNHRATSIEMKVELSPEDENLVLSFDAYGSTILGKSIHPSCKEAEVSLIRFAEDASTFFTQKVDSFSRLKGFVEERKKSMSEKYVDHPINATKDAIYNGGWDGNKAKQDLVKEKNYKTLAPKVCLKLEDGWENREVTKLGYPVMGLFDGEWRYSSKGLASAQAYAEQHDESEVLNKIKKIKKKLDLDDDSEGKEEKDMGEIEFSAVNIGDLWGQIYNGMREIRHWDYSIKGIYEEDNQKFAIVYDNDMKLYRLDFSLTEEGLVLADEIIEVKEEFIETDNIKKFAEPEDVEKYQLCEQAEEDQDENEKEEFEDKQEEMSLEQAMEKIAALEKDVEDKDNIIMEKDGDIAKCNEELEVLRKFKQDVEDKQKAQSVESILEEVKNYMSEEQLSTFRQEGLACEMSQLDSWSNKVKAVSFETAKNIKVSKKEEGVWSFAAPVSTPKKNGLWD